MFQSRVEIVNFLLSFIHEIIIFQVIIGDNLGCHFSEEVIVACRENNIAFVSLIPNSTHMCQALDVFVFRPMKILWRKVLQKWRRESRITGYIPKTVFPSLLREVVATITEEMGVPMKSGNFRKNVQKI